MAPIFHYIFSGIVLAVVIISPVADKSYVGTIELNMHQSTMSTQYSLKTETIHRSLERHRIGR
jgi:hypothetical protein